MNRPPLLAAWLLLCTVGGLGLGWVAVREARERSRIDRELATVREEIQVRLGRAERHRDRLVVGAPFATWAHLVAGLHEAAAASGLDRFRYATLGVVPLEDPAAPVAGAAGTGAGKGDDEHGKEVASRDEPRAPYRAMRARVEGSGTYGQLVSFVRALASVDPPLRLDRLVVRAGPDGPSFEAYVHLVTALPVESPRVVALDRVQPAELPPGIGEVLAGVAPPGVPAPPVEVTR